MSDQFFDDPTAAKAPRPKNWKRKGDRATPSPIGSGPPGEHCKSCVHATQLKYHDKRYYKCHQMREYWTHGGASDIKLGWDACLHWHPAEFEDKVRSLGEFANDVLDTPGGITPMKLFVIADFYEEQTGDMGWLRHVANRFSELYPKRTGG